MIGDLLSMNACKQSLLKMRSQDSRFESGI